MSIELRMPDGEQQPPRFRSDTTIRLSEACTVGVGGLVESIEYGGQTRAWQIRTLSKPIQRPKRLVAVSESFNQADGSAYHSHSQSQLRTDSVDPLHSTPYTPQTALRGIES